MRLKSEPSDFRVREVLDFAHDPDGPYFVHRLRKQKLDTLSALAIVARHARVPRADIAFAGLKDRQGDTEQWISIRGARADFREAGVHCRFVGRARQPVSSKMSRGNEFEVVVRDLDRGEVEHLARAAVAVSGCGFANYFDDQRFSCIRHGQGFVMQAILAGRHDEALRRLVAVPSGVAITGDVKLKRILKAHWGDWARCAAVSRGPVYRRVFERLLREPDDHAGAIAMLPSRLRLIHAYAFQSLLWNRAVDRLLAGRLAPARRVRTQSSIGSLLHWRNLRADELAAMRAERTPLYGPEGDGGGEEFRAAMHRVLRDERLTADSFLHNRVPGMILREEPRQLVVVPRDLRVSEPERDDRNRGRLKLRVEFGLPRGSYATLLIKRLLAGRQVARGRPVQREPRSDNGVDDG